MGCNVHLVAEYCDQSSGEWMVIPHVGMSSVLNEQEDRVLVAEPIYVERSYYLFSALAGVRSSAGSPVPVAPPRGLPADCHPATRLALEREGYYHSHSWLTWSEARVAAAKAEDEKFAAWVAYAEMRYVKQQRIVFAFDN